MEAKDQETYIKRLGELGYCWQFITLAGLHSTALISDKFAREYAKRGMRAYGELIQEPEMDLGVDVVTHQKWSGAVSILPSRPHMFGYTDSAQNLIDRQLAMLTGGVSSTSAMGKGVTEDQFKQATSAGKASGVV